MNFNELPPETKELAETVIEATKHLSPPWKASPEEPYAIRRLEKNSSEDTQRFNDIDRHPTALKWMVQDKPSSNEDLDYLLNIDETDKENPRIMWAIVNQENEPVGWVQYYKDTQLSQERRKELDMEEAALVLEVSYAKLFSKWPKHSRFINDRDNLDEATYGEVVLNGIKQTLIRMAQMEDIISKQTKMPARSIYIIGYTDPKHRASAIMLAGNGFKNIGETDYEGEMDNTWVKKLE